jgi:hypothetical protein
MLFYHKHISAVINIHQKGIMLHCNWSLGQIFSNNFLNNRQLYEEVNVE